jgi:hypothetical protein
MSSSKVTLIANPKSRKDWDNNKLYYQQKFFSKTQQSVLNENTRKADVALKQIAVRQPSVSGVDGGSQSKKFKLTQWKIHSEGLKTFQQKLTNPDETVNSDNVSDGLNDIESCKSVTEIETTPTITIPEVDDWEDLL